MENIYLFSDNYSYHRTGIQKIRINNDKNGYTKQNANISIEPFLKKLGLEFEYTIKNRPNGWYGNTTETIYYMTKEQFENNVKNNKFFRAYLELENGSEIVLESY